MESRLSMMRRKMKKMKKRERRRKKKRRKVFCWRSPRLFCSANAGVGRGDPKEDKKRRK
jgi:hypothetical protein